MISTKFDSSDLNKKLDNLIEYSYGFFEGIESGKANFRKNVAENIVVILGEYIDSSARVDPQRLHHVYEWDGTGNKSERLFELGYSIRSSSIKISYNFTQSQSIKAGSNVPFYNKAEMMESGTPVTITPKMSRVLVFQDNGETVFTSKPVVISDPGGMYVQDGFKMTLDEFFRTFSQAFLEMSGVSAYISDLSVYKKNLGMGGRMGGRAIGYKWISNAGKES